MTVLLAGGVMSDAKKAYGAVKMPEVDKVVITVITDNYYDALRPDARVDQPSSSLTAPDSSQHRLTGFQQDLQNLIN